MLAAINRPMPTTAQEFKQLCLDWLHTDMVGDDYSDANLAAWCEFLANLSDKFMTPDEWEQFCVANDMA